MSKFTDHIKKNGKTYLIGAGCVAAGVVGTVLVYRFTGTKLISAKQIQVLAYKSQQTLEVYIEALGDPGNIIQDIETGTIYASQNQAARELGINAAKISKQLNGHSAHADGHVFSRLGKAAVQA